VRESPRRMSGQAKRINASAGALSLGGAFVLALGALDFGLESSIVIPALKDFAQDYNASLIAAGWLTTAYLLAAIVAVPTLGRLGDIFGKRRMLLVALGAFAFGSLIAGMTHSVGVAITGRAIQGVGVAAAPLTLGLVRDFVAPEQLPRMIGTVIGAANVGGAIGFLMSGILVDSFSAPAIFWFLFGFGILLFTGIATLVPESPVRARVPLDPGGAIVLGLGLVALLLAISKGQAWGWSSAIVVALFAGASITICGFVLIEQRVHAPFVDLRLLAMRPFVQANLCAFVFGFAFFVGVFVLPLIAATPQESGYGLGFTTTKIGLLLLPTSAAGLGGSWAGGRLVELIGSRALTAIGFLCGVAGYASLAALHTTALALAAGCAVVGLGWGLVLTGIYPVVFGEASLDKGAIAPAVVLLHRNAGLSVGVTISFVIITAAGSSGHFPAETGFTWTFLVAAVGSAAALLVSLLLPRRASAPQLAAVPE
jgi:MFS family permease